MRIFSAIAVLALLAATSANAAELSAHFRPFAGNSALRQAGETARPSGEGWTKLCFDVPTGGAGGKESASQNAAAGGGVQACYTYAVLRDPPTQIFMGIYGVLQIQPAGKSFLIALLPLYSAMPPTPGYIQLDGTERIQLSYFERTTCDQSGCWARAVIPALLLDRMKNAKTISFGAVDVTGRDRSVPLPCCAFAAAFDGTAVPDEAKDDTQRKIQEALFRRFMDFVR
jgi:invasion protein IalB